MKPTVTLTFRILMTGLLLMTSFYYTRAWDKTPDDFGKYDGIYDRPTYFSEWEQPTTWPNAMYYLCEVRLWTGGPVLENYEIAVYDQNNQLRHCSRSIAGDDNRCVLTIRGEEGDVFHFQVVYGSDFAKPEVVNVKDVTCSFKTNDIVGSDTPFELTIGEVPNEVPTVQESTDETQYPIYDLQGRSVPHPSKGVYIFNGKKIIIR